MKIMLIFSLCKHSAWFDFRSRDSHAVAGNSIVSHSVGLAHLSSLRVDKNKAHPAADWLRICVGIKFEMQIIPRHIQFYARPDFSIKTLAQQSNRFLISFVFNFELIWPLRLLVAHFAKHAHCGLSWLH